MNEQRKNPILKKSTLLLDKKLNLVKVNTDESPLAIAKGPSEQIKRVINYDTKIMDLDLRKKINKNVS
jgi:hypothetical protein